MDENSHYAMNLSQQNDFISNLVDVDSAFCVFATDWCSPTFWTHKTRVLLAIVKQIGTFTLFFTILCNPIHWTDY